MKRLLHICGNARSGGILSFVTWITDLNPGQKTVHDILLTFEGRGDIDGQMHNCTVHHLNYDKKGFFAAMQRARKVCRAYDAVLIHTAHPVAVLPLMTIRRCVLLFQHGMAVSSGPQIKRFVKRMWFTILPVLLRARVVCSTVFASDKLRRLGIFVQSNRRVIIPFGVPVKRRRASKSQDGFLRVGIAGNLVDWKRHHLVLESLEGYDGTQRIQVAIAGHGPEEGRLREIANRLDRDLIQVDFLGQVEDMDSFYRDLDLVVIPSRGESFGLVALEALCRGLPVAVFKDVGGCLSLINDRINGFVMEDDLKGPRTLWRLLDAETDMLDQLKKNIDETDLSSYDISRTRLALEALTTPEK